MTKEVVLKDGRTMTIRRAEPHDAEEIISFAEIIAAETDNLTFGPGEFGIQADDERAFIKDTNSKDNSAFFVGVVDGAISGMAIFLGGKRPRIRHAGDLSISVRRSCWGVGAGEALMKELLAWAKATGIVTKVNLDVRTDNEGAIRLYRKLGFTDCGLDRRAMNVGGRYFDCLLMELFIDG